MKFKNIICGLAFHVTVASVTALEGDMVLQVDITSVAANPNNPELWNSAIIPINAPAVGRGGGPLTATMPLGQGLWFGLYAVDTLTNEVVRVAAATNGPQPDATLEMSTLDTNSSPIFPRTRADKRFEAELETLNFSIEGDVSPEGTQLSVNTRRLLIERYSLDYKETNDERSAYTQHEKWNETRLISSHIAKAGGTIYLQDDRVEDGTATGNFETGSLTFLRPNTEGDIKGDEYIQVYFMANHDESSPVWMPDAAGAVQVLAKEVGEAFATDSNGAVDGQRFSGAFGFSCEVRNLYPDSTTYVEIFKGSESLYKSEAFVNSTDASKDNTFVVDKSAWESKAISDGTYRIVVGTITVFTDTNGDGKGDGLEEIRTEEFTMQRSIYINGKMVSGTNE
jgi:hypothetical protein